MYPRYETTAKPPLCLTIISLFYKDTEKILFVDDAGWCYFNRPNYYQQPELSKCDCASILIKQIDANFQCVK